MSLGQLTSPRIGAGTDGGDPVIDVRNLHVRFTGRTRTVAAVRGIDLRIRPGEAVAIVGESGSGKSVTARSLVGLAGPGSTVWADAFTVAGRDVRGLSERGWQQLRGRRIGLVLQDALTSLDPLRTVRNEIAEVLRRHRIVPRSQVGSRVVELLDEVGFPEAAVRAGQYPHQLSGGLRQRALIASAIAGRPDLIVADEPTTALDVTIQLQILRLLADRVADGTALLLISHDLAVVSQVAERVLVMHDGVVVESGPTEQVLKDPAHEYTRRLIAAVPSGRTRGHRLSTVTRTAPAALLPAPSDGPVVLEAQQVSKTFQLPDHRRLVALSEVDLRLRAGQKVGIVGESGSGKSTLARVLLGLLPPDSGVVRVRGVEWHAADGQQWQELRRSVQFVSQDPFGSFDPRYTVAELIAEPLRGQGTAAERDGRTREVLSLTHLGENLLGTYPRHLSGGQRQRVSIARALALRPDVLICDEPVSALDVSIQAQILDLLTELNETLGTSLVFISHDLGVVHHLVDDVLVMQAGRIVESGEVGRVLTTPATPYTRLLVEAVPRLAAGRPAGAGAGCPSPDALA